MIPDIRLLGVIIVAGVLLLFGASIYSTFDGWMQTTFNGPEYCFKDISESSVSLAAQGIEVKYTKIEGNMLCFRTKDSSIPERINQQVQDRLMQERLAEIEVQDKFMNDTLPFIILIVSVVIIAISIISHLSTEKNYSGL